MAEVVSSETPRYKVPADLRHLLVQAARGCVPVEVRPGAAPSDEAHVRITVEIVPPKPRTDAEVTNPANRHARYVAAMEALKAIPTPNDPQTDDSSENCEDSVAWVQRLRSEWNERPSWTSSE